jgi:hypothetical protein
MYVPGCIIDLIGQHVAGHQRTHQHRHQLEQILPKIKAINEKIKDNHKIPAIYSVAESACFSRFPGQKIQNPGSGSASKE